MTTRDHAPLGAPCWADLWTSDVDGARRFYGELFGWASGDPDPAHGGYFMFTRDGVDVAGGMGDMGPDLPADDTWKIYLATDDIGRTAAAAADAGAQVVVPPVPVDELGLQAVLHDPAGALLGAWQARRFPGFTVLDEHGAPSWFELFTRDYAGALDFYRSVFGWELQAIGDTDEFGYSVARNPEGDGELAGIMDAAAVLSEGEPAHWSIYWEVDAVDDTVAAVRRLGGTVLAEPQDSPYGRLATVTDPAGARFKLRTGPR